MRRLLLIIVVGLAVSMFAPISRSESVATQPDLQEENALLRAENERLRGQLQKFEELQKNQAQRFQDMDRYRGDLPNTVRTPKPSTRPFNFGFRLTPPATRPSPFNMPFAPTPGLIVPDQNNIPKDWAKREFNGQPFYIIPCK